MAATMPPLSSDTPGPVARPFSMRNGRVFAAPRGNTVSMCAISSTLPWPVPVRLATMLSPTAGLADESSIEAPSLTSCSMTMAETSFRPSASPVPESMLTSLSQSFSASAL